MSGETPVRDSMFAYPREDFVAGVVVFLVALPLCLGIAVACGVPPVSGLIAGICGGVIVSVLSKSPLSVSGPAAGLTSIVLVEVEHLGGVSPFLTAVMIAGVLQVGFGLLRTGRFSALVPSAVIKGMLAAIGITIVWKQLPVAFGVKGGLADIVTGWQIGPTLLAALSLGILYGIKYTPLAKVTFLPGTLIAVVTSSVLAYVLTGGDMGLAPEHYVTVPLGGFSALAAAVPRPELAAALSIDTWVVGMTIAVVASIETLLSLQAVDRLDPLQRQSPPDRELVAQGVANTVSGFLGGLPLTAVIVRSGANVAAGGRERLSALVHGILLLVAVVFAGPLLNSIPLACLAAVLVQVGMNLCKPALFAAQAKLGATQLVPFLVTIGAVLALNLLEGVIVGIIVGAVFVLYQNANGAVAVERGDDGAHRVRFRRDGTFVSKPGLMRALDAVQAGERVVIDGTGEYIDHDVKEALAGFVRDAPRRKIHVDLVGVDLAGASADGGH